MPRNNKTKSIVRTLYAFIMLVIGAAAIPPVANLVFHDNSDPKINVTTLNAEELTDTRNDNEPELDIFYEFKGERINHLLRYKVEFSNVSSKTIISTGSQRNIIDDTLIIHLRKGYQLIEKKVIYSNFPNKIILLDSSKIAIIFEQWRENEKLICTFYIRNTNKNYSKTPFTLNDARPIINGNIHFLCEDESLISNNKKITDSIPRTVKISIYIVAYMILAIIIVVLVILILTGTYSYFQIRNWYNSNFEIYKLFINKRFESDIKRRDRFMLTPSSLPDLVWKDFSGEKFPSVNTDLGVRKLYKFILLIISLIVLTLSIGIVFIDLIYYFP